MYKFFCDRCGKEYLEWGHKYQYEVKRVERDTFPRKIDLCDNCRNAFEDWMDKFLENEEVGE